MRILNSPKMARPFVIWVEARSMIGENTRNNISLKKQNLTVACLYFQCIIDEE